MICCNCFCTSRCLLWPNFAGSFTSTRPLSLNLWRAALYGWPVRACQTQRSPSILGGSAWHTKLSCPDPASETGPGPAPLVYLLIHLSFKEVWGIFMRHPVYPYFWEFRTTWSNREKKNSGVMWLVQILSFSTSHEAHHRGRQEVARGLTNTCRRTLNATADNLVEHGWTHMCLDDSIWWLSASMPAQVADVQPCCSCADLRIFLRGLHAGNGGEIAISSVDTVASRTSK